MRVVVDSGTYIANRLCCTTMRLQNNGYIVAMKRYELSVSALRNGSSIRVQLPLLQDEPRRPMSYDKATAARGRFGLRQPHVSDL